MRPTFSVLIPTYEPDRLFVKAIQSVLAQDFGAEKMQISIIDDASPTVSVKALLGELATNGRIEIHLNDKNLGLAGNWNRAIAQARGELVHLLHQDDVVRPGFYRRMLDGFARNDVGMAFCRHAYIDEHDRVSRISHRERWRPGLLSNWLERIGESQRIQCPSAVLRKGVYDRLGGFRADLRYALDWEMWVRVAANYAVWYEPSVLACYRQHQGSETSRLRASTALGTDVRNAIELISQYFPASKRAVMKERGYRRLTRQHLRRAKRLTESVHSHARQIELDSARAAVERLPDNLRARLLSRRIERLSRTLERSAN